jgi:hypothetical protein
MISKYAAILTILCYGNSVSCMEKNRAKDESHAVASGEQKDSADSSGNTVRIFGYDIPRWGVITGIAASGVTLLLGVSWGLKRGVDAASLNYFKEQLKMAGFEQSSSTNYLNFLADVADHVPKMLEVWKDHGAMIKAKPHNLLAHTAIIEGFTTDEKARFLQLMREFTIDSFRKQLEEIFIGGQHDIVEFALANPHVDILTKYSERLYAQQTVEIPRIYGEIDSLRDFEAAYCQKNNLGDASDDHRRIEPEDWRGRMKKLIDAFKIKFPYFSTPFDPKNITFFAVNKEFMQKLNDEQREEFSAIFDVYIKELAEKEAGLIVPRSKPGLLPLVLTYLFDRKDLTEQEWSRFSSEERADLKLGYARIGALQAQKEYFFRPAVTV